VATLVNAKGTVIGRLRDRIFVLRVCPAVSKSVILMTLKSTAALMRIVTMKVSSAMGISVFVAKNVALIVTVVI
jgi:hypothetical protein